LRTSVFTLGLLLFVCQLLVPVAANLFVGLCLPNIPSTLFYKHFRLLSAMLFTATIAGRIVAIVERVFGTVAHGTKAAFVIVGV